MIIGNIIIHRASYIRKKLEKNISEIGSEVFLRNMQVYQCRILGLCIYRQEFLWYNFRDKLNALKNKHNDNNRNN